MAVQSPVISAQAQEVSGDTNGNARVKSVAVNAFGLVDARVSSVELTNASTLVVQGYCAVQLQDGEVGWVRARVQGLQCEQTDTLTASCAAVRCDECSLAGAPSAKVAIEATACRYDERTGGEIGKLTL